MLDNEMVMTAKVEKIAEQVKALPEDEREEFLSWLADFEMEHSDDWDKEIARDSRPGGRLERVLGRVRKDIAEGRTKPLNEVLDNS
jgi:DNA-binding transcriptional ArsR family regulator